MKRKSIKNAEGKVEKRYWKIDCRSNIEIQSFKKRLLDMRFKLITDNCWCKVFMKWEDVIVLNMADTYEERKKEEFEFIIDYIHQMGELNSDTWEADIGMKQLRSLWTSFCIKMDLIPDTSSYDVLFYEMKLYFQAKHSNLFDFYKNEEEYTMHYRLDLYMGAYLV